MDENSHHLAFHKFGAYLREVNDFLDLTKPFTLGHPSRGLIKLCDSNFGQ